MIFIDACDNCDGDGGWAIVEGRDYCVKERWVGCPSCGGSGRVDREPEPLTEGEAAEPLLHVEPL